MLQKQQWSMYTVKPLLPGYDRVNSTGFVRYKTVVGPDIVPGIAGMLASIRFIVSTNLCTRVTTIARVTHRFSSVACKSTVTVFAGLRRNSCIFAPPFTVHALARVGNRSRNRVSNSSSLIWCKSCGSGDIPTLPTEGVKLQSRLSNLSLDPRYWSCSTLCPEVPPVIVTDLVPCPAIMVAPVGTRVQFLVGAGVCSPPANSE